MTTILMPLAETPTPHRFTRDEYQRMADDGYFEGTRVQLLDGEIIDMPAQKHGHYMAINRVVDCLKKAFGPGHWVRSQGPLLLLDDSMPEPDVAVTQGAMESTTAHPTSALLVVEVSDSTLAMDRRKKSALYARAGITDYWILNLVDRQLEVHRRPAHGVYESITIFKPHDSVSPLAQSVASIAVSELLP